MRDVRNTALNADLGNYLNEESGVTAALGGGLARFAGVQSISADVEWVYATGWGLAAACRCEKVDAEIVSVH
jgi:hypothetical protein